MTNKQKTFCAACGNEIQPLDNPNLGVCSNCKIHYVIHNGTIIFGHVPAISEVYNTYLKQPPTFSALNNTYLNQPPTNYCNHYGHYHTLPEYSSILSRLSTLETEIKDLKNKK